MPKLKNLTTKSTDATILFATDEWFACAHNLLNPSPPSFDPNAYCPEGKVMDGWETRRKRIVGHDWCVIKLGRRHVGRIVKVEVDTAYFTGNYVPSISLWASAGGEGMTTIRNGSLGRQGSAASEEEVARAERVCGGYGWVEILGRTRLEPGYEGTRYHEFSVPNGGVVVEGGVNYIRLNYFPDGGVARLKVWGEADSSSSEGENALVDFAAHENGGWGVGCSNRHYGEPSNLSKAGRGVDMSDGWETARHSNRPPVLEYIKGTELVDFGGLTDWAVIELGGVAEKGVEMIVVDTAHFKGNFPESVKVEGCFLNHRGGYGDGEKDDDFVCRPPGEDDHVGWFVLLDRVRVTAHSIHTFQKEIVNKDKKVSHVRVTIYPDGGLSRLRIFGKGPIKKQKSFQRSNL